MRRSFTWFAAAVALLTAADASAQCERPQLLLTVDKSSSMLGPSGDGTTKWEAAESAISDVVTAFSDSIDFGLQVFPMPNRCEPGEIVVDVGRRSPADILAGLGTPPPSAGNWTPMSQTLDVATTYTPLQDDSRDNVLVLITDGWQWCDPYDASTRFDMVASVEALRAAGITVFVVGFGDGVDALALNRAAVAAGTERAGCDPTGAEPSLPNHCYLVARDAASLSTVLGDVARETAAETCDGIDNDCNGNIDEGFDVDEDGFTVCGSDPATPGVLDPGDADCDDTMAAVNPDAEETCDEIDNDCDGEVDPGCACTSGDERSCGMDEGACLAGTQTCTDGAWGACEGAIDEAEESCNGSDDDCDGTVDEEVSCPSGTICELGECTDFTTPPVEPTDTDMDGLLDESECPGGEELDTDGDGIPNCEDPDDDGDGILTINERPGRMDRDTDGDGPPDHLDADDDGDGIPTMDERPGGMDRDTDGDGPSDHLDADDDGDSIPTRDERPMGMGQDTDTDGVPNHLDADDDGDGIPTRQEAMQDETPTDDFDGDGSPSYLDEDSDADMRRDADEGDGDDDLDGAPNYLDPAGRAAAPTGGGCGCGASGAPANLAWVLLAFVALLRRRRI